VIEGQARKALRRLDAADHHGDLLGVETFGDKALQKIGKARRQFRRLHHNAIARRQSVDERR